jgi:uncharacterized membrane protein
MFISLLCFTGLVIWIINLSNRIEKLERGENENKESYETIEVSKEDDYEEPEEKKELEQLKKIKKEPFRLEDFLGRKFFSILGIISIVIAIGFFAMWAFAHSLIGPQGRIALGVLASLGLLVGGELMKKKYPKFFSLISSAGIASLLVVTFLARNFYELLSPEQSFLAYIVEVSAGIILALRYDSRVLGNFSILGGVLAPILIQSPNPDAIGLLSYLSVLAVAGFIVSVQKNWPEIVWMLFIGITGFEIGIFHKELLLDLPLVFLVFAFGLHSLLGSGGIIRKVLEKTSDQISLKIPIKEVGEMLLFVISIFTANGLGYFIFNQQEWSHFGFFVLAQGFLLFGLSTYLKSKGLIIFQKICIVATFLTILFATIWEMEGENQFVLTMMLIGEGALFDFVGEKTKNGLIKFFGCLALVIASCAIFSIDSFAENTVAIIALLAAGLFSITSVNNIWEKIWGVIAISIISIHIFHWSFFVWVGSLQNNIKFLIFLFPAIWSAGVAYMVIKSKSVFSPILGWIIALILNLSLWFYLSWGFSHTSFWFVPLISLLLVLFSNFAVLSSFFIKDKKVEISKNIKSFFSIATLGISTINVLIYGDQSLNDPVTTLFWILWGGVLLGLGMKNNWIRFRYFGIGMFCFIISKLYLVDLWELEVWIRFIAFLALGISLLSISFLYQKINKK